MRFRLSHHINFPTRQWNDATRFYKDVLGLVEGSSTETYSHFVSGDLNIYFDSDDSTPGPIFEFVVDDLNSAKQYLTENGCEILRWDGPGKPNYVRDPFGFVFNVFEEKS